jgi:site-specific DNA-methyltransferase (adenine-specific)
LLAERLIKLFSFAGDTMLDPFAGTGTTRLAAITTGRNSVSNEIEPASMNIAEKRLVIATSIPRVFGSNKFHVADQTNHETFRTVREDA